VQSDFQESRVVQLLVDAFDYAASVDLAEPKDCFGAIPDIGLPKANLRVSVDPGIEKGSTAAHDSAQGEGALGF
jgi:hypothetical protein